MKAAYVNSLTAFVIAVFLLLALIRLESKYRGNYRFVFYSIFTWWLGWLSWVVLWYMESKRDAIIDFGIPVSALSILLLLLSDLNTTFDILTYFGLTRGRSFPLTQYWLVGLLLVLSVTGIDVVLGLFPGGNIGQTLQIRWSMALSMFSPVLIGWAFRLRYGSFWVLITGIIYAFLQPPAYEALFGRLFLDKDEYGAAILWVLSLLKVVYAVSVLVFVGRMPPSYKSLVRLRGTISGRKIQDSWWPLLPRLLAVTGLATVIGVALYLGLNIALSITAILTAFVIGLIIWLNGIKALGNLFISKRAEQAVAERNIDVFLSYSVLDKDQAMIIYGKLKRGNYNVFLAGKNIEAGELWEEVIRDALTSCRHFWVLLTPNSLHSQWVITEWAAAWTLHKRIVPILSRCKQEQLPKSLQSYQHVDLDKIDKAVEALSRL